MNWEDYNERENVRRANDEYFRELRKNKWTGWSSEAMDARIKYLDGKLQNTRSNAEGRRILHQIEEMKAELERRNWKP